MQASAEGDSTAVSEAPSSGSEDSDCEPQVEDGDAALTEEWARELLAGEGVVSPHEVHVESRAGVAGALSRVLAVTVCYEEKGESKSLPLVVKLPPRDPFGRLFVAEAQFDTREILFYTELAPALNRLAEEALGPGQGLPVPKCIKARLPDEIGGDSELVLEDVTSAGYEAADFAEGLSEERARAALHAAARLHALSLALREREGPLDQRFDFLFPCERAAAGYLRLVKRGLPQLEGFLRGRPDCVDEAAAVSALSARAPSLLGTLLRPAEPAPLAHADFWSGNLLFREHKGKSECIALDWQMVSLGRPMDDVALLLLSSLTPDMRRAVGDKLIEDYGNRLEEECARLGASSSATIVRRGLMPDWPRAALRALLLCAGSVDVALGDPRAETRLLEAVKDLYAQGVLALKPDTEA
ncbi:ecdysteroid kinase domain-containing protein [Phthorimaea operculella]|nr:ecdysteroid kinase domain-containing protein [Phthorimaea operculella]